MDSRWESQTSQYGGNLQFAAVTNVLPAVTIPFFLKDYTVPVRVPKMTEVLSSGTIDYGGYDTGIKVLVSGAPQPLSVSFSGFLVTPTARHNGAQWYNPTTDGRKVGTSLKLIGISYAELILAYIEGRVSLSGAGRGDRVDPSAFVDPYGNKYNNPIIQSFEASQTSTMKKQQFSMTLVLEDLK